MTSFRIRTTHGYAAVGSRRLRLSIRFPHSRSTTEEMIFLNTLTIAPRKNQDGRSVTVDPGTWSRSCLRTRDGYSTDNPGLKPWRFWRPCRESVNYAFKMLMLCINSPGENIHDIVWRKHVSRGIRHNRRGHAPLLRFTTVTKCRSISKFFPVR